MKIASRKFTDFGVKPSLGFLLIFVGFIVLSEYLFRQIQFAPYLYVFISWSLTATLSAQKRNDFLQLCFHKNDYLKVRMIENSLVTFPFLAFLVYKQFFLIAFILFAVALFLAWSNFRMETNFTLPTPFYKKPFEFIVGFRKSILGILGAILVEFIAISVNNFNLGIFAFALLFLIILSFYTSPEDEIYVWNYNVKPSQFLLSKIKIALGYSSLLTIPFGITLTAFYPEKYLIFIALLLIGLLLIVAVLLAKYAAYPSEMSLSEGIVIALGVSFPPLLLIFIPYFYFKAIQKLTPYLGSAEKQQRSCLSLF